MTSAGYVDPEMLIDLPAKLDEKVGPPTKLPEGIHSMSDVREAIQSLPKQRQVPYDTDPYFAIGVLADKPQNCELCVGGDPYDRKAAPHRGAIDIPSLPKVPAVPAGATGRLELAQWMTQPTHPLTSRVMVNRIWSHLFGTGLVRTVDDFGMTGLAPRNAELLDHLAVRFVVEGWSVKKLIRNIMLSHTYRLSSATNEAAMEMDADNVLLWRMTPRRLEFEALRDSMLMLAGGLKFDRPSGIQVMGTGGKGNTSHVRSRLDLGAPYRTVYLPVIRDSLPDAYSTFDFPPPSQIKGQRDVTTAAPQSLWFLNSEFVESAASGVAGRERDVQALYRLLLSREASAEETADAQSLIEEAGVAALVQAMMGTAEFRYVF
jgi:hypothetical protein